MEVPDGWRRVSVEQTLAGHTPGFWGTDPSGGNGNILVLRSTNFRADGRLTYETAALRVFPEKKLATKGLLPGDILLERSGGGPKIPVGRICIFDAEPNIYSFSNFMGRLRPDRECVNEKFLFYRLWQLHADGTTTLLQQATTGIRNLNFQDYLRHELPLPPLAEQKKIAEILGSVDEAIQATQAVIDQTRKVKQGLLQQLLTRGIGHTRFKQTEIGEIPDSWDVVSLVELVLPERPIAYGVLKPGPFVDGGPPMLRITDIRGGRVSTTGLHRISRVLDEEFRRTRLEGGETVISLVGTIGLTARVPESLAGANLHRNLGRIVPGPRLDSYFLARAMESDVVQKQIARMTKGGNQPLLNLGDVKNLLIPVPPRFEQEGLVERLQSVSDAFEANEVEFGRLLRVKTGLVADLLSGRVRVKVDA